MSKSKWTGKPWIKPIHDPIAKDVAHVMKENKTTFTISDMHRKTGLAKTTCANVMNGKTGRPQITTLSFILRYLNKELVIRDKGSNR